MNYLKQAKWSPYLAGALLGVLSWFSFLSADKALGVSTTFVRAAGTLEALVMPGRVQASSYFSKYLVGQPAFEWQFALVIAIFLGALVSSKLSGDRVKEAVPSVWRRSFGDSRSKRNTGAFLGGMLLLYGARLAGGCTSGHGISGALQLSVSGWVFMIAVFSVGIPFAYVLYGTNSKRNGGQNV